LQYKISFEVPAAGPGVTNVFAGNYSLQLKDVMDAGLAFADAGVLGWNYRILVGTTVVYSGTATGSTAEFTFTPALIEQYLVGAPAGTEVSLIVRANMVKLPSDVWPTSLQHRLPHHQR